MAVSSLEGGLLLIAFPYSHLVVGTGQVQLGKSLGLTQSI